jgi:hypothetical protein
MIVTGENRKNSGKNFGQRHFVHNKSHIKWPWIVPWFPLWQAKDISISTVGLCNENQTRVLYTMHQAWWLINRDHDQKIIHIKQCVQLAQALNLAHILSMAQILLMTLTYFTGTNSTQLVSEGTPDFCRRINHTSRSAGYCHAHKFSQSESCEIATSLTT